MSKPFVFEYSGVDVIDLTIAAFLENPIHITLELLCISIIGYLLSRKPEKKENPLTEQEIDQIVDAWQPEPLEGLSKQDKGGGGRGSVVVIEGPVGHQVTVKGASTVNFTTSDFLSLNNDKRITDKALKCIDDYGCGSCGPRGFYGTIDVHVELEERIAKFMGTNKAIIYSADIATATSVLPTFAKAADVIVVDDSASFPLQEGAKMSRARIVTYKHGDLKDLELKLQMIKQDFVNGKHNPTKHRRFIVVEGISYNTGHIAPLDKIVSLKKKYGFRLIVDESQSIGVLGHSGRGCSQHFNIPINDIEIITASMSTAMSTMGGFCTGTDQCVDHQRLSGSGYVFSASSPPYLSVAGTAALDIIDSDDGIHRQKCLANNAKKLDSVVSAVVSKQPYAKLLGDSTSPLRILSLPHSSEGDRLAAKLCAGMLEKGVLVASLASAPGERRGASGLRLMVTADHSDDDINKLGAVLSEELEGVLAKQS